MSRTITLNCKRCGAPLEPGGPGVGAFAPHVCDSAAACVAVERLIDAALDPRAAALHAAKDAMTDAALSYAALIEEENGGPIGDVIPVETEFFRAARALRTLLASEKEGER